MNLLGKWAVAVVSALGGGYVTGLAGGSGVAMISVFFCVLMLGWVVIYRPWEQ
jgi:hypothetical protein